MTQKSPIFAKFDEKMIEISETIAKLTAQNNDTENIASRSPTLVKNKTFLTNLAQISLSTAIHQENVSNAVKSRQKIIASSLEKEGINGAAWTRTAQSVMNVLYRNMDTRTGDLKISNSELNEILFKISDRTLHQKVTVTEKEPNYGDGKIDTQSIYSNASQYKM